MSIIFIFLLCIIFFVVGVVFKQFGRIVGFRNYKLYDPSLRFSYRCWYDLGLCVGREADYNLLRKRQYIGVLLVGLLCEGFVIGFVSLLSSWLSVLFVVYFLKSIKDVNIIFSLSNELWGVN